MKHRDVPKMLMAGLAVSSLLSLHPVFGTVHKRAVNPSKRPNIILILADGLGYSEISCHGNRFIETPRFDRACGGMRRTKAYTSAAVCSPTRSADDWSASGASGQTRPFGRVRRTLSGSFLYYD
jgi:hypothetical protein